MKKFLLLIGIIAISLSLKGQNGVAIKALIGVEMISEDNIAINIDLLRTGKDANKCNFSLIMANYVVEGIKGSKPVRVYPELLNGPRASASFESSLFGRPIGGKLILTLYILNDDGGSYSEQWHGVIDITENRNHYVGDLSLVEMY